METTITRPSLLTQIACVGTVESCTLERLRHEALTVPQNWVVEYGRYQSGGWHTVSLMNSTGDPRDVRITDCDPVATTVLDAMPVTKAFLAGLGLRYMWVRLARLQANSFLWEHRDYDDLDESERHRLHVPLVTNSSAALVVGGARIWLQAGRIWRLTPTHVHGACNLLGPDRLHLVLDCYADDTLRRMTAEPYLVPDDTVALPAPPAIDLEAYTARAATLIALGYGHAAEKHLLRLFYQYAMPEGQVYDLIAAAYEAAGRADAAATWEANKSALLGLEH